MPPTSDGESRNEGPGHAYTSYDLNLSLPFAFCLPFKSAANFSFLGLNRDETEPKESNDDVQKYGNSEDASERFAPESEQASNNSNNRFSFAPKRWQNPGESRPPSGKFSAEKWVDFFKNLSWVVPPPPSGNETPQQQPNASASTSPRKQAANRPKPASVSTEGEEERSTFVEGGAGATNGGEDGEAMDVDDDLPATGYNSFGRGGVPRRKEVPPRPMANNDAALNMKELHNVTPFTNTNSGGINDLADIGANLPFQSRPKHPAPGAFKPRDLKCPNPPKRPLAPTLAPASAAGSTQLCLSRQAWDRYVSEMDVYMREWKAFNGRMIAHFSARQEAIETGLSSNWIRAVGDSARLPTDDGADEELVAGTGKGGYGAYLRAVEEDEKVRNHWEFACELHKDCVLYLGVIRDQIRNGVKMI